MKQLAIITVLSLITITQAFSQARGARRGEAPRGGSYGYPAESPYNGHHQVGQQVFKLKFNNQFRGQSTIKLKQELKFQNPGFNPSDFELVSIKLVAKSKHGGGEATLAIGQSETYPSRIYGNQYDFHNSSAATFSKVKINNPARDSQGKWQVHLRGNIKVKKVVITVKEKPTYSTGRIQSVMIPMYGQYFSGQSTIKIKQLMKQFNPSVNLKQAEIVSVSMMAKSKHGGGQASLEVGQAWSYPSTIYGTPRAFNSSAPRSFSPIHLRNSTGTSQGSWQIELRGNIKVQHIMVNIKTQNSRGRY